MKNLVINRLIILSEASGTANQFEFSSGKNLITSKSNTVGKSTLVKMILWALGCKPKFDREWQELQAKTAIVFKIDNIQYTILREGYKMSVRKGTELFQEFSKIGGDYSSFWGSLVCFKPVFKIKRSECHQVTTPDGYFLAYYLDQEHWDGAWESLDGFKHFETKKSNLIKAHTGILTMKYFDCINDELVQKSRMQEEENILEKYDSATKLVQESYADEPNVMLSPVEMEQRNDELKIALRNLELEQSSLWQSLAEVYSRKHYLESQISILENNINDLDNDYKYSLTLGHIVTCPICNSQVNNDVVNKAGILSDKVSAEVRLEAFQQEMAQLDTKLASLRGQYTDVIQQISDLNSKCYKVVDGTEYSAMDYISSLAGSAVSAKLHKAIFDKKNKISSIQEQIEQIEKEKKSELKKVDKNAINNCFCALLKSCESDLDLNYDDIRFRVKSAVDYKKVIRGGAADKTRSILSYYSALFLLIKELNDEVVAPLIIDTPKQQEQSDEHEALIMNLINNKLVDQENPTQIFLCCKDSDNLVEYKKNATIFDLTNRKGLLREEKYQECLDIYNSLSC